MFGFLFHSSPSSLPETSQDLNSMDPSHHLDIENFKYFSDKFIQLNISKKHEHLLPEHVKLEFYGLYKYATEGPCNLPKPSWLSQGAYSKYQAWNDVSRQVSSKEEAQQRYIEKFVGLFQEVDPELCRISEEDKMKSKQQISFEMGDSFGRGGIGGCSSINPDALRLEVESILIWACHSKFCAPKSVCNLFPFRHQSRRPTRLLRQ